MRGPELTKMLAEKSGKVGFSTADLERLGPALHLSAGLNLRISPKTTGLNLPVPAHAGAWLRAPANAGQASASARSSVR